MLRAGETLKKGFLAIYAGELTHCPKQAYGSYSYAQREYRFKFCETDKELVQIDSITVGNGMRLLTFLPDEDLIQNFSLSTGIEKNVALANMEFLPIICNGVSYPAAFVREDITAPKEHDLMLGFNYGPSYLCKMAQNGINFKLLNKSNLTYFEEKDYSPKKIRVELEGTTLQMNIPRVEIMTGQHERGIRRWIDILDENTGNVFRHIIYLGELYDKFIQNTQATTIRIKPTITQITPEANTLNFKAP